MSIQETRKFPFFPYKNFHNVQKKAIAIKEHIELTTPKGPGVFPVYHSYDDQAALYEIAYGMHDDLTEHIVQFGTYRAGSACMMGMALKDSPKQYLQSPMITIDPYPDWNNPVWGEDAYLAAQANILNLGLREYVCPVIFDDLAFIKSFWRLPVRLVMIDTIHQYEVVRKEIEVIRPHLVQKAWLFFHDYHERTPAVCQAVNEFIDRENITEIYQCLYYEDPAQSGIVMRLP